MGLLSDIKAGVDIVAGIGSLFGMGGSMSQKDIMKWQEKMMARQFTFQSEQARMNREFQSREAAVARDWNAIGAQLKRAQESGVNPNYLVSSGNYGSAGSSPSPSGSMASGSVAIPSAPPVQRAESFNLVAQGLAALSSSRLDDATAERTKKLLASELNKVIQEGNVASSIFKLNVILAEYLPREKRSQLDKLSKETDLLIGQGNLTEHQINKVVEEYRQLAYDTNVKQIFDNDYWKSLKDLLLERAGLENQNIISDTNLKQEKATSEESIRTLNYSKASEAEANVELMGEQGKYYGSMAKLNNLAYDIRQTNSDSEKKALAAQFAEEAKRQGIITDQLEKQLERLAKENRWIEFNNIVNAIGTIGGVVSDVRGSFGTRRIKTDSRSQGEHVNYNYNYKN